ncbi:hypothetical protein HOLleu_03609 [Holothuria leucospilota]|uniref:Uncharacterized protein n=1 Tax=Holothuria leucospilota TaxID=206669 RepID=A0A9Q1CS75_HOLLE|nr:hypothetical protein HOLleu_03609 [Holothuria leucospilota]
MLLSTSRKPHFKPSAVKKEHENVDRIKADILSHDNLSVAEGDQLYNFITQAYIPHENVPQILNIDDTGQKFYVEYVAESINGVVSLWAQVKEQNNKMYMSGNQKQTVKIRDQSVDLKETKDLYGRLMVLTKSSRHIDQKNAIGNYEFNLTPRALFAPDGLILLCSDKSKLIHSLENFSKTNENNTDAQAAKSTEKTDDIADEVNPLSGSFTSHRIAVVAGMVLVQKMTQKPVTITTVKNLGQHFNDRLMTLTAGLDDNILVFDTYE